MPLCYVTLGEMCTSLSFPTCKTSGWGPLRTFSVLKIDKCLILFSKDHCMTHARLVGPFLVCFFLDHKWLSAGWPLCYLHTRPLSNQPSCSNKPSAQSKRCWRLLCPQQPALGTPWVPSYHLCIDKTRLRLFSLNRDVLILRGICFTLLFFT